MVNLKPCWGRSILGQQKNHVFVSLTPEEAKTDDLIPATHIHKCQEVSVVIAVLNMIRILDLRDVYA